MLQDPIGRNELGSLGAAGLIGHNLLEELINAEELMAVIVLNLGDPPQQFDFERNQLGRELGVSKERVRQLEVQALGKMRKRLEADVGPLAREYLVS